MKTLQQSVVQIARDPCALTDPCVQRHIELLLQLPDSQLVGRPQQCNESGHTQRPKPIRLVISRSDGEIESGGAIIPDAVTVGCSHAKRIPARRQICKERLPSRTGLVPVTVVPVEPIAKLDPLRNQ